MRPGKQPGGDLSYLTGYYNQIPGLYDTRALQAAAAQYRDSTMRQYESSVDAQAAAAQNRGARNGAEVGSSFTKGQLMLGALAQGDRMNYDYAQMAAQMMGQRAGQQGQTAYNIANLSQNTTQQEAERRLRMQLAQMGNQLGYDQLGLDYARLGQGGSQFDQTFGLEQQKYYDQRNAALYSQAGRGGGGLMGADVKMGYLPNAGPVNSGSINGIPLTSGYFGFYGPGSIGRGRHLPESPQR